MHSQEGHLRMKRMKMLDPSEGGRSKRLRFSALSQLIVTEPKTNEELQDAWYNRREIDDFKRDARLISKALRETRTANAMKHLARSAATGSPQADIKVQGKEVIRGIEHMISPDVLKLILRRRRQLITAVLEEQRAQRACGLACDLRTAQVSEAASSFAREWCSRITHFQH